MNIVLEAPNKTNDGKATISIPISFPKAAPLPEPIVITFQEQLARIHALAPMTQMAQALNRK